VTRAQLLLRTVLGVLVAGLVVVSGVWGAFALWYQAPGGRPGRAVCSGLWVLLLVALAWLAAGGEARVALAGYLVAQALALLWWRSIRPSHQRVWADDVAQLLHGQVEGHRATLHHVRNFTWRRDDDYDVRWETRVYDLDHLAGADAILSYWDSPAIAHAMISFGFDDGRHLVFSVEIRKKRGEAFSEIGGFFKQFEMILVAADERDIVRVRTNVRGEDDYLFPLVLQPATARALFVSYIDAANALVARPAFYNTITSNCTTLVYRMARQLNPGLPMDPRLLLTGYLQGYLRDNGAIDASEPAAVQRARARITERARRSGPHDDFSRAIRAPA
jgi:hypothetical protein